MKTKFLCTLSVIILTGAACKKSVIDPKDSYKSIDIVKAVNSGVLFGTWLINDEDVYKQKATQNSTVFTDKLRPELTFGKNKSYLLNFTDSLTAKPVSEKGTWSVNGTDNTIILQGSKTYTFSITTLNEEDVVFIHMIPGIKTTTSSEGITSSQATMVPEILYMEDND